MAKFVTRLTVVLSALYFLASYLCAYYLGVDILRNTYTLLFELCVVCYTFLHGAYHCRFIRWTAASIFVCDSVSHADYYFNLFEADGLFYISLTVLVAGLGTSTFSALRHFYQVSKVKRNRKKLYEQKNTEA